MVFVDDPQPSLAKARPQIGMGLECEFLGVTDIKWQSEGQI